MKKPISLIIATISLLLAGMTPSVADWKPSGPIKMLIAFKAGGGADTQARLIAEELEKRHGWEIIPEQLTGGGGAKLTVALKDEPNDGTVIGMVVTETYEYNMLANPNAGYTLENVTPLTTTAGFQMGVVSLASKGWKDFQDVKAAAQDGEKLRFGAMSPKLADLAYLLGEANGIDFNIIEVKGGKAVMNGVNAGDMDLGFMAGIQSKGVAAGDLVNLASAMSTPLVQTPDAPRFSDLGVPFAADGYFVFVAPAGLPEEARDALTSAIVEVATDPESKAGGFLKKAFGGSAIISGDDLVNLLTRMAKDAEKLLSTIQ